MKKHLILAGVFSVAIIQSQPAMAVTKCVALNSSTTCSSNPEYNKIDWSATCTTYGISTQVKGIAICSNTAGTTPNATTTELEISSTVDDNKYCWCKMTTPAVSRWVFNNSTYMSASDCAQTCAYYCLLNGIQRYPAFRSAMFGSLSD